MKRLALLSLIGAVAAAPCAIADQAAAMAVLQAGCAGDAQRFCSNVPSGGGRIIACLKQNYSQLTDQCKQAGAKAQQLLNGGNGAAGNGAAGNGAAGNGAAGNAAGAPPAAAPAANLNVAPAAKSPVASATKMKTVGKSAPGSYVLVKKVELMDPGAAGVSAAQPAYELMIPPTWTFKGTVNFGGARDGCFADLMAVSWEADSADKSLSFSGVPTYSWQYTNSPTELHNLNDPGKRSLGAGGKPCPVAKPMRAQEYLQTIVLPNLKGTTLESVEQYPQLDQMARQQLGLPASGGNGAVQTEAIRARVATTTPDGRPAEAWYSLVVVTSAYQVGGGTFWNCQVIDFTALSAVKGQLDANDKLYRVMISAVQPVPKWLAYENAQIARFNQAEAKKNAVIDQAIAQFQQRVVQAINGTVALSEKGANTSAFTEGQVIRGVQTFRDPATGKTMELSNQYDHAWKNAGSDEYVMSDDPSFNPKSALSGSWDELQVVHPAP